MPEGLQPLDLQFVRVVLTAFPYVSDNLAGLAFQAIACETVGETLKKEDVFGTIEAVKTVSDLFMPLRGEILEVNPLLEESPDVVNEDPYGRGWMVKIKIANPSEAGDMLTAEQYKALL